MPKDYYSILGINSQATESEIKDAYRKLAKELHPDVNSSSDAEAKFSDIAEAYSVLGDKDKKHKYDNGNSQGPSPFSGMWESLFNFQPREDLDINYSVSVSLEEVLNGCEREIEINRRHTCNKCAGHGGETYDKCQKCQGMGKTSINRGIMTMFRTCEACQGKGRSIKVKCSKCEGKGFEFKDQEKMKFNIPCGIFDGALLKMGGKGHIGQNGQGSVLVAITIEEHERLERQNDNLIGRIELNYSDLVFGCKKRFSGLDDEIEVDIPAGTQAGQVFTFWGRGLPQLAHDRNSRGSLDVIVNLVVPTDLSPQKKRILQRLKKLEEKESTLKL